MEDKRKNKPARTKERKELIPSMVRGYLNHSPSNVACMQIMRPNSNRRSRASIFHQCNLPFYSKG